MFGGLLAESHVFGLVACCGLSELNWILYQITRWNRDAPLFLHEPLVNLVSLPLCHLLILRRHPSPPQANKGTNKRVPGSQSVSETGDPCVEMRKD